MTASIVAMLEDIVCGGLAAAGFAVLFNVGWRCLPWCLASGALALAVRSVALTIGLRFEAASFSAALILGFAAQLVHPAGLSRKALQVVGCIPMIPGAFAARAILGLFAVTTQPPSQASAESLTTALVFAVRVILTLGALGTGIAIPDLVLQRQTSAAVSR